MTSSCFSRVGGSARVFPPFGGKLKVAGGLSGWNGLGLIVLCWHLTLYSLAAAPVSGPLGKSFFSFLFTFLDVLTAILYLKYLSKGTLSCPHPFLEDYGQIKTRLRTLTLRVWGSHSRTKLAVVLDDLGGGPGIYVMEFKEKVYLLLMCNSSWSDRMHRLLRGEA